MAVTALVALAVIAAPQSANSQGTPTGDNAYSAFFPGEGLPLPNGHPPLRIATLDIPAAGNYVVNGKLEALNKASTDGRAVARCFLNRVVHPGDPPLEIGEGDMSTIDLERDRRGMLVLQFAYIAETPGEIALRCYDGGTGVVTVSHITITATQVASLVSTRIVP